MVCIIIDLLEKAKTKFKKLHMVQLGTDIFLLLWTATTLFVVAELLFSISQTQSSNFQQIKPELV